MAGVSHDSLSSALSYQRLIIQNSNIVRGSVRFLTLHFSFEKEHSSSTSRINSTIFTPKAQKPFLVIPVPASQAIRAHPAMPPTCCSNIKYHSSAIEPYPKPISQTPVPSSQIAIFENSSSSISPSLQENPARARASSHPLHEIPQVRAQPATGGKPRSHGRGPRQSKERPGGNSMSVILKP